MAVTAQDGRLGEMTKVVDHGPDGRRWNLLLLGDGYRREEGDQFRADVDHFVDGVLRVTPPFDQLWPAVNVHSLEVVSHESGADDPYECADDSPGDHGRGTTARTYFDSTVCDPRWGVRRLLTADTDRVRQVVRTRLPGAVALLLVNTDLYGGSGDPGVAVCSRSWVETIALHELGHSAFGLADEYDGGDDGGPEPKEPNVTRETRRARLKWRSQVLSATPIPTWRNPICHDGSGPPEPAGERVGTYEGARYQQCGVYRPFPDCYMRYSQTFCQVCRQVIVKTLAPHRP